MQVAVSLLLLCAAAPTDGAFWSADGTGRVTRVTLDGGRQALRCDYRGAANWTYQFGPTDTPAGPSDVLDYGLDLHVLSIGPGAELFVCLTLLDAHGATLNGLYAPLAPDYGQPGWHRVSGRCAMPRGAAAARLTLWGTRSATVGVAGPRLRRLASPSGVDSAVTAATDAAIENETLRVDIHPSDGSLTITDKRTRRVWETFGMGAEVRISSIARQGGSSARLEATYLPAAEPMEIHLRLEPGQPELAVRTHMSPHVPMPSWAAQLDTTPAFCSPSATTELVVPYGEGFLYPTTDPSLPPRLMQAGDGAGLTMPWHGVWDRADGAAALCMLSTDDDALGSLYFRSEGGRSAGQLSLRWMSQLGRWGYDREARYWFATEGGYVALCKRYREEARRRGLLVTLEEKAQRNPAVRRLLGAPILWFPFIWHRQDPATRSEPARWLHDRGVERAVFGSADALPSTDEMVEWGWIPTQYDLYSDIWRPEDRVAGVFARHFDEGDLRTDYTGQFVRGWVQVTEQGSFPGYNLCPTQHAKWARRYVPPSLAERTMVGRFVDTTTALPLGECYNPRHPMSRTRDREARLELLRDLADLDLVVGSEIGVHWGVPVLSYSEGMLSPVAYRHPEAGRLLPDMLPVPATEGYILNPAVRVPLWELVFHDCQIVTWYWGDATNTFPSLWPRRNAFSALYATPPIYMVLEDEAVYEAQRDAIVRTDERLRPIWPAVGFSAMESHEFLSEDRMLQATDFASGARIIVNFAAEARMHEGQAVPPLGYVLLREGRNPVTRSGIAVEPARISLTPITVEAPARRVPGMDEGADLSRIAFRITAPWMRGSLELRFPEVLQSTMGFHFLDHYRADIAPLSEWPSYPEWVTDPETGAVSYAFTTPEGLEFGGSATPSSEEVALEFHVRNATDRVVGWIQANHCLNLEGSPDFAHRWDLTRLYLHFGGAYQPLDRTTPTPAEMGRQPWLAILSERAATTYTGPRDLGLSWIVDQTADPINLMGAVSADERHLVAYTWHDQPDILMSNCGFPCLHTGTSPSPDLAPGEAWTWRGKVYLMENDVAELLRRVEGDPGRP